MTTTVDTHTLAVPGATVSYDIRPATAPTTHLPLLIFGSPMEAPAFATLASHFSDRTVLTYDPRRTGRSPMTDPLAEIGPAMHAADLQAILGDSGLGRVDVFTTSGGAVNALVWVAEYRPQVRLLVAHEPPVSQFTPDRDLTEAAVTDIAETYQTAGEAAAMAKFITLVSREGP